MNVVDTNILPEEPTTLSSYKWHSTGTRIGSPSDKSLKHGTLGVVSIEEVLGNLKSKRVRWGGGSGREIWYELNASILYYLFLHQDLIPDDWKGREIVFTGTEFISEDGAMYYKTLRYQYKFAYTVKDNMRDWISGFEIAFREKEKSKQSVSE